MTISPGDLRPWSAYILGHHPWTLRQLQLRYWDEMLWVPDGPASWIWRELNQQLADLEEALFVLGLRQSTETTLHFELRSAFDGLCEVQAQILEAGPGSIGLAPGRVEWDHLIEATQEILFNDQRWIQYCHLGCLIGQFEYDFLRDDGESTHFEQGNIIRDTPTPQPITSAVVEMAASSQRDDIRDLGLRFERDYQSLRDAIEQPNADNPTFPWRFVLVVSQLDSAIRSILKDVPPPPMLLCMSSKEVTFLDTTFAMPRKFDSALAFLWVLAEQPRTKVSRERIKEQSSIKRGLPDFRFVKNELIKRYLKDIVRCYYGSGGSRPEEAERCFIKGHKGRGRHPGPYELEIDRSQVRINGSRPEWMPNSDSRTHN